ncbi:MAG TPA: flagellar motor switch phosphatase FliY [Clostridiaceae bacterium]|nr:flagellar motor switch phosphatase FliY [Clostridiaceae bacterium]
MENSLSQAEIDALLKGIPTSDISNIADNSDNTIATNDELELSLDEIDTLGEIGNISIGTSATTLFTLLGHKVLITTPNVTVTTWEQLAEEYTLPYVAVRVEYISGLEGTNLLILKEDDVKIITDLMMGGNGTISEGELTDFHLSAISEAMNQMVGSAATSMSSMFNKRIEISPPKSFMIKFGSTKTYKDFISNKKVIKISFKMIVDDLIDSEIMQLLPITFAKSMVNDLVSISNKNLVGIQDNSNSEQDNNSKNRPYMATDNVKKNYSVVAENQYESNYKEQEQEQEQEQVNVQPVHFLPLEEEKTDERHNISLVEDIPLQVTVELGKTKKLIKDILKFNYGTIIELDKLAGEPVDILINGKNIAKGEVVVIDDSFGVRITDIVHPSKRI